MRTRPLDLGVSVALLLSAIATLLLEAGQIRPQLDDAYISYRYADNLVRGLGLVYNEGEYVEGITNLLWTLLVAFGIQLGFAANHVGHALGIASACGILVGGWAYALAFLEPGRRWLAGVVPWLVLASTPFLLWSTSGMETSLYAALTIAAIAAFAWKRLGWTTLFLALATLTRPDAGLSAAILFAFQLWKFPVEGWRCLRGPLAYAAVIALVTGFRLAYYGSPVPNTFYAKVGGVPIERGIKQVQNFLSLGMLPLLLPAALAVARRSRAWPGAAVAVAVAVYVASVGGDVFLYFRFLVPLVPILAGLAVIGVATGDRMHPALGWLLGGALVVSLGQQLFGRVPNVLLAGAVLVAAVALVAGSQWALRRAAAAALATAAALLLAIPSVLPKSSLVRSLKLPPLRRVAIEEQHLVGLKRFEVNGKRRSKQLLGTSPPVRLVATGAIGALGYHSRLPILDIYGLVDHTIARTPAPQRDDLAALPGHQRSNVEYVMSREPDYILIPKRGSGVIRLPAIVELWEHPDLERLYVWDDGIRGYRRATRAKTAPGRR